MKRRHIKKRALNKYNQRNVFQDFTSKNLSRQNYEKIRTKNGENENMQDTEKHTLFNHRLASIISINILESTNVKR